MNPLDKHPKVREILLLIQWLVTGAQAVCSALFLFIYGESPDQWPVWFMASLAVAPVLWAYLGFTAQHNVTGTDATGHQIKESTDGEPV